MRTRTLISILNWNGAGKTEVCLKSLFDAGYFARDDVKIVVTDNGSAQHDLKQLRQLRSAYDFSLIENSENVGFAPGHNAVIRTAEAEGFSFCWMLNNDATVVPGSLEALLDVMERDDKCACAGPLLVNSSTNEVYFSGATHCWETLTPKWLPVDAVNSGDAPVLGLWSVGTANLLRLSALHEIGLMAEDYFAYFEDDEFGERILHAGWRTRISTSAKVAHELPSRNSGRRPDYFYYLWFRNIQTFFEKYGRAHGARWVTIRMLVRAGDAAKRLRSEGHHALAAAVLLGSQDALDKRMGRPDLHGRSVKLHFRVLVAVLLKFSNLAGRMGK